MPSSKFAVVYSPNNIIIRIIDTTGDSDDSAVTRAQGNLALGESIAIFNLADFPIRNARTMQASIGVPAHSGRCAHIVNGQVVNIIHADPAIYQPPTGQLVHTDIAGPGWAYDGTNFSVKVATVTVSANALQNGMVTSVVTVSDLSQLAHLALGSQNVVGGQANTAVVGKLITSTAVVL